VQNFSFVQSSQTDSAKTYNNNPHIGLSSSIPEVPAPLHDGVLPRFKGKGIDLNQDAGACGFKIAPDHSPKCLDTESSGMIAGRIRPNLYSALTIMMS
jgi:hypothetical protein